LRGMRSIRPVNRLKKELLTREEAETEPGERIKRKHVLSAVRARCSVVLQIDRVYEFANKKKNKKKRTAKRGQEAIS